MALAKELTMNKSNRFFLNNLKTKAIRERGLLHNWSDPIYLDLARGFRKSGFVSFDLEVKRIKPKESSIITQRIPKYEIQTP